MVRFKNRYLLLEVHWEDGLVDPTLSHQAVLNALRDSISSNFGDFGFACVGKAVEVKYWNKATSLAIVRTTRSHYRMVWAAATFITRIGNRICAICARHIGGMRSCSRQGIALTAAVRIHQGLPEGHHPLRPAADEGLGRNFFARR